MPSDLPTASAPKESVSTKQSLYQVLRGRILHWHYPPGFHLGEQSLSEEFKLSRIPVREALGRLATEGFVDRVPNQGCFVKQLNVRETLEWFEVRLVLEMHVGERLALHPEGLDASWVRAQRAQWERLLEPATAPELDVSRFVSADSDFHFGLARACGNERILRMIEEAIERLRFVKLSVETTPERLRETATEHLAILDAIRERNAVAVRAALKRNIEHSSNRAELAISRALLAAHNRHSRS